MEEKKTLEELAQPLKNWLVEHNDEVPSSKIVIDKYSVVVIQEIMGGSLNKTIEEPKQEENDQKSEPFRIKKGKWYVCIHDFCNKAIRIGEIIQAEHDNTIRGIGFLYMENKYFRPAFRNEIPQKSKWNENDEHHLRMCLGCVEECAFQDRVNLSKTTDWLKSLKQRMEEHEKQDVQNLANSAKISENDTLLDLFHKMPTYITVDGICYHFMLRKTIIYYTAFYEGEGEEGKGKTIFLITGDLVDILNEILRKLKEGGLLE